MILCYQKSAQEVDPEAQHNIAICRQKSIGLEKHLENRVQWYQMSAQTGHSNAQYNLAVCYEQGWGVEIDFKKPFGGIKNLPKQVIQKYSIASQLVTKMA